MTMATKRRKAADGARSVLRHSGGGRDLRPPPAGRAWPFGTRRQYRRRLPGARRLARRRYPWAAILPHYLDRVRRGLINPKPELKVERVTPMVGSLDGQNGLALSSPPRRWPRRSTWRASSASASSPRGAARISAWRRITRCRRSRPALSASSSPMPRRACRPGAAWRRSSAPARSPRARRRARKSRSTSTCRRRWRRAAR